MKRLVGFLVLLVFMYVFPIQVSAVCVDSELAKLNNAVSESEITYEYIKDNEFSITISNITQDFYVQEFPAGEYTASFVFSPTGYSTMDEFIGGTTLQFNFYASYDTACAYTVLRTVTVILPKENFYYTSSICDGAEAFFLCKKFANTDDYTYKEIVEKLEEYKISNEVEETKEAEEVVNKDSLWVNLYNSFFDNFMFIMISIIVLSVSGIIIIRIREKRRSLV